MIDYDAESASYDSSRGGEPRAAAAADAVERLLPQATGTVLDLACGTGIVTRRLARPGRTVLGVDRSPGMLALAAQRLPRHVLLGDAGQLPLATASVDAVTLVWLLHLLPDAAPVLAEAARVLRPGGVLITTVDKGAGYFTEPSDIAEATEPLRRTHAHTVTDRTEHILSLGTQHGLTPAAETTFRGIGQGRSPYTWRRAIEGGSIPWASAAPPDQREELCTRLSRLPAQHAPRPDPCYRLLALKAGAGNEM
ncbi:class I SAM-dependent methyltransferase [Streptomyces triticagri]|uniref:Class I SAM-dependent methyltransferase n=1 Tax=Streptomyces triticagri TaxID=2293568 RepID=A0A372M3H6_9ACTN|nr:class I SAM-dependent methyltransferase [Streptomyces triticagri]RFU84857.1 class I SAM-dependent methyltransferase [Streptomyces triticagri]